MSSTAADHRYLFDDPVCRSTCIKSMRFAYGHKARTVFYQRSRSAAQLIMSKHLKRLRRASHRGARYDSGPGENQRLLPFDDGAEVSHDAKDAMSRVVDMGDLRNSPRCLGR